MGIKLKSQIPHLYVRHLSFLHDQFFRGGQETVGLFQHFFQRDDGLNPVNVITLLKHNGSVTSSQSHPTTPDVMV